MTAQQLKNSILQMAVQGKLVPQDPSEEPASVLLERIRAEKEKLIKAGKIKREKNPSVIFRGSDNLPYEKIGKETRCIADEIPFEIPDSWEWSRIGSCIELVNGRAYKQSELLEKGKYRVLRVGNFFTNSSWYYSDLELPSDKYCQHGDLLYAWSASFGPRIWDQGKTIFHYHIWNVKFDERLFLKEFLFYFLLWDKERLRGATTGSTMIHISMEHMYPRFIMIPPLAEQKRIVAKIEELLPHLEDYDRAETRVTKLNADFPEQLKKSILQWAIQGKLVPQNPDDEPASALLERIRAEKAKQVKAGKIKKDKAESVIFRRDNSHYEKLNGNERCIDDEIPFEIPDSWEWCRCGGLFQINPRNTMPDATLAGFMPMPLLQEGFQNSHTFEMRKWSEIKNGFTHFQDGDIVIAKITPCFQNRKSAIISGLPNKCGAGTTELHVLRDVSGLLFMPFFLWIFKTHLFIEDGKKHFSGTAGQQRIGKDFVSSYLIPLPPLAEQKRIVDAIEHLFRKLTG